MALLEARPYRPFKSEEEYLYAMKEDLAEWLNALYPGLDLCVDNFMDRLENGVLLCKHANAVRQSALDYVSRRQARGRSMTTSASTSGSGLALALALSMRGDVRYVDSAKPNSFFARDGVSKFIARDNVCNFIAWCRRDLGVIECLLFETEDLTARKNEKHVILCLLEVARRGARLGMLAPMLVQLEREIDREIAMEARALQRTDIVVEECADSDSDDNLDNRFLGPMPQIVTNDLKSLDEMVRDLVRHCQCPTQFPMIKVSEGKYRIGDTKVLIFVRVLRSHVMVRVGGGWDTLAHYLDKHDPCRCSSAHRTPVSAKLVLKNQGSLELNTAQVHYERSPPRTRRSSASSVSSGGRPDSAGLTPQRAPRNRSRSPTPGRRGASSTATPGRVSASLAASTASSRARSRSPADPNPHVYSHADGQALLLGADRSRDRSRSPTPRRTSTASTTATAAHSQQQSLGLPGDRSARGRSRSPSSRTTCVAPEKSSPSPSPGLTKLDRNRDRSTSPAPRHRQHGAPELQKKHSGVQLEAADDSDFPRAHRLVRGQSPSPVRTWNGTPEQPKVNGDGVSAPIAITAPGQAGDSGSEVGSDEGYRSLGIATTPPSGEKKSIIASVRDSETGDICEEASTRGSSCSDLSTSGDVLNANVAGAASSGRTGIPTPISSRPGSRPGSRPSSRPSSRPNSRPQSRRGSRDRSDDIEEALIANSARRKSDLGAGTGPNYTKGPGTPLGRRRSSGSEDLENVVGGLRRLQAAREREAAASPCGRTGRSRSASAEHAEHSQPAGAHRTNGVSASAPRRCTPPSTHNSWGAGRKPRPALQADTFTRGTPQRASLPTRGRPSRSVGRQTNGNANGHAVPPTNNISPILEQILQGSDLHNDAKVLQKMKDIIQHYAAIVDEKLAREEEQEQLDFTSAWVRGLPSSPTSQLALRGTPRKDSHPQGATSRIPAPVTPGKHRV